MLQRKTARRVAVATATAFAAACQDATPSAPVAPSLERSARAQERLEAVFQRISPDVMDLPGTVYSDNDEAAGKVVIGVENMGAARGVQNAMQRLGVVDQDYEVKLTAPIQFARGLRDSYRPTIAGIQINFPGYLCTMGFNVTVGGGTSFITNSHCTTTQGGVESTPYWQPSGSTAAAQIAVEVADPVYRKQGCSRGKKCRASDASRAQYINGVSGTVGVIAKTTGVNNGSLELASGASATPSVFTITSQDNTNRTFSGTINKVGRTTGWTAGPVSNTCVTVNVQGSTVQLTCQTLVTNANATIVGSGDSGSGAFKILSGDNVQLVGILWGGSGDGKQFVFSPLRNIQDELGSFTATK